MKENSHRIRTLALEIRMRRMGFAVLDGNNRLLEWGVRSWHADVRPAKAAMKQIAPLLSLYSPSVVVLKDMSRSTREDRKKIIMEIRRILVKHPVEVQLVKRADVRRTFHHSGSRNKYQIAGAIATMFPELRWKLPRSRKPWQPELRRTAVFDAISLAVAHRSLCGIPVEPPATEIA